ncbi:MAG: hypothetical protein ACKOCM_08780 [Cyanobacteriota bacterium]
MREIAFQVLSDQPGRLEARADEGGLCISAGSLEELHHEAREALIGHLGGVHGTVRIRIRPLLRRRRNILSERLAC